MADTAENLRTAISGSSAVLAVFADAADAHAVEQGSEPQNPALPRIWYGRSGSNEECDLDGAGELIEETFDVEVISDDLDECQDIASVIKHTFHGTRGTFGTQTVNGIFVNDQNDDYVPKGIDDESGYHVAALSVTVWRGST